MYVRNAAGTVAQALESVVSQSYPAIELVVVDGASTDGTTEIIGRYSDRIAWFVSEPDSGPVEAANKCLARVTGDIVVLLMADDWLEADAISEIVDCFLSHPTAAIVSSGARIVETSGGQIATVYERRGRDNGLTLENLLGIPLTAARYWRREWMTMIGQLDSSLRYSHDRDWFVRSLLMGAESAEVDRILYTYRRHKGSATLMQDSHAVPIFLREHVHQVAHWLPLTTDPDIRRRLRAWRREQHAEAFFHALHRHDYSEAARWSFRGAIRDPGVLRSVCHIVHRGWRNKRAEP